MRSRVEDVNNITLIHRFTGWRGDYHDSIAYHGFNVWENNPKCKFKKDGKDSTGCNGIDAAQECTLKFMTHEAGL